MQPLNRGKCLGIARVNGMTTKSKRAGERQRGMEKENEKLQSVQSRAARHAYAFAKQGDRITRYYDQGFSFSSCLSCLFLSFSPSLTSVLCV